MIKGRSWINPKIIKTPPKKILVVDFIKGISSKSSIFFLLCLNPNKIEIIPNRSTDKNDKNSVLSYSVDLLDIDCQKAP